MRGRQIIRNQQGFTLIEIIAVLVLIGILAAVAVPKYMDLTTTAREKAAMGQIAEVKGRLSSALNGFRLANGGTKPASAADLLACVNASGAPSTGTCPSGGAAGNCPTTATTEGDFEFSCAAAGTTVTITVSKVQTNTISANNTGAYTF